MTKILFLVPLIFLSFDLSANSINLYCSGIEMNVVQNTGTNVNERKQKLEKTIEVILFKDQKVIVFNSQPYKYKEVGEIYNFYYFSSDNPLNGNTFQFGFKLNRISGDFDITETKKIGEIVYTIDRSYNCSTKDSKEYKF